MSDMWDSVAPGWAANAGLVDGQLAAATERLLDAAQIGEGDQVLDLATGPGGSGLAAARRVGRTGRVVLSDASAEMVAVAASRADGEPQVTDLATGPGGSGLAAARRVGRTGRVVLSDASAEMVAVAASRADGEPQV